MNFEQARANMIENQIRPAGVLDQRVLDLLYRVRREDFVPAAYREYAFADMGIPLGNGAAMLSPKLEARIVQELAIKAGDRILEVGTGSGYVTAVLAGLGAHVYSVEIVPKLSRDAGARLAGCGITNVTLEIGDAARGWDKHVPYDAIVIGGSLPILPPEFERSLNSGGRMFVVVGDPPAMRAKLITRLSNSAYRSTGLFETSIPVLRNAPQPERFEF
ncbi:MAG: protein-L-isoaspartate O-methyltransferase family protein [Burkholderiales bacterium]